LSELFGPWANNITVHNLIFMQSGLNEYETPTFDMTLEYKHAHEAIDALTPLKFLADMPEKSPCATYNCTWSFFPGTHT